jgi:uncharacterized membrane protein
MFHQQNPVISLEIVLNPPRARHATAAAKLDISPGSVLNKMVVLLNKVVVVGCAAPVLTATNVSTPRVSESESNFTGGKIGHIARNCPMNEGGYGSGGGFGGGQQGGGYNDSGKTCYACGGFGILQFHPCLTCRPHGKGL